MITHPERYLEQAGRPRQPVFRFAPSPNGFLHLGHAYSALMNREGATRAGGSFLLRMEDIDRERCREAYVGAIVDDLDWLGVTWEGPVLRQSERMAIYAAALDALAERDLAYPCFCTRGAIAAAVADRVGWPVDPDGMPLYPGTCKALPPGERRDRRLSGQPAALRLDMARALESCPGPLVWQEFGEGAAPRTERADPAAWGDALIARKDIRSSYHLAVVVDDARQGVSDVVRGDDLFQATALHRLLQCLLGLAAPRYRHHRLILDATGRKLSKSRNAPSLRELRGRGASPDDIRSIVGLA